MSAFTDHIVGAESDTGYELEVSCPTCRVTHRVALTRAGRFMFRCCEGECSGQLTPGSLEEMRAHMTADAGGTQ